MPPIDAILTIADFPLCRGADLDAGFAQSCLIDVEQSEVGSLVTKQSGNRAPHTGSGASYDDLASFETRAARQRIP